MTIISYTELQNNLKAILQRFSTEHQSIKVILEDGESLVMIPQEEYELLKTLHSISGSKKSQKQKRIKNKLDKLRPHNTIIGDPDELIDLKIYEWNEEKNL